MTQRLDDMRGSVEADYTILQAISNHQGAAAILRGLLYVGQAIAELREDLRIARDLEEERHRDLMTVFADGNLPKELDYDVDTGQPIDETVEGEIRLDPDDGNAYIKRIEAGDYVQATDILGGHMRYIPCKDWESWKLAPTNDEEESP